MSYVRRLPHFNYGILQDDQIRILTLMPGPESSPIYCEFHIVSCASAASSFSALSYCWGPQPRALKAIIINKVVTDGVDGKKVVSCDSRLAVWPNLHNALVTLRRLSQEPQRLWIDALCINQGCLLEKKNQIQLMSQIYISAMNVIIWLGEAGEDSDFVMESISNNVVNNFATERFLLGMIAMLARPWFQRTWIVQEFVLNPAAPLIACGCQRMITWTTFMTPYTAAFGSGGNPLSLSQSQGVAMMLRVRKWFRCHEVYAFLDSFRDGIQSRYPERSSYDLGSALYATRSFHATDPRDKIFGILSLTQERTQIEFEVDYHKSVEEVFRDAMIYILQKEKSIAVYGFLPLRRKATSALPSWVPNFAASQDSQHISKHCYINEAVFSQNIEDVKLSGCRNKLVVKGRVLDMIQTVITIPAEAQTVSIRAYPQVLIITLFAYTCAKIIMIATWAGAAMFAGIPNEFGSLSLWQLLGVFIEMSQTRIHGIQLGQALIEIERLVAKCTGQLENSSKVEPLWKLLLISSPPPNNLGSDEECQTKFDNLMAALRQLATMGRPYKLWIVHEASAFLARMQETAELSSHLVSRVDEGRRFFACDSGWYGICEGDVEENDQLALLFPDVNVPFILRKKGECFEMVGPARVPDGMPSIAVKPGISLFQEFIIE